MNTAARQLGRTSASNLDEAERWFHTLVQNSSDLIGVLDENACLIYGNAAHEHVFGFPARAGLNMLSLIHPDDRERAEAAFKRDISERGVHPSASYRFRTKSGEWRVLELVATNCLDDPAIGGIVVNSRDITERTHLHRALQLLGEGNQILVRARDEESLLAEVCENVVSSGGYKLAWVGYAECESTWTIRPVAAAGCTDYVNSIPLVWPNEESRRGPLGTTIKTGRPQVTNDIRRSNKFKPWMDIIEDFGLRSSCHLPLVLNGQVTGVFSIYAGDSNAFDPPAVQVLSRLAEDLSYGIGRIRDALALRVSEERFRTLAGAAPIGIIELSPVAHVDYANPGMAEITGRSIESLMGWDWVEVIHPDDRAMLLSLTETVFRERTKTEASFRILRPDGEIRQVRLFAAPKAGESGYVVTVIDVTEEVKAQEQLTQHALYDSLTGLPNRSLFLDRLGQELGRRVRDTNVGVLFLDIDRFTLVNESLGHEAGDEVLKEVARRLSTAIRSGETLARFGGDQFMVILRDIQEVDGAVRAAKRLLGVLDSPIAAVGQDVTVTASVGIVLPKRSSEATDVLRDANTAMCQAKRAGGNRYEVFDAALHRRSVVRLAVESELHAAIELGQFEVYYQPKLALPDQRPMGAEALVRWRHPTRGIVSPLEFIPIAEDSGLIKPIGELVLEQALSQLAAWDAQRDGPRLDVLAINVSIRQLDDPGVPDMVRGLIERSMIEPARVSLEVTESAVRLDNKSSRRALEDLKKLGIRLAIDDFGTGYSSLADLHRLPVTTLKIDRSFVERMDAAEDSTPLVQAIVDMAHAMGLRVVAEGVSEERLASLVAAAKCDAAQGFYWSPPLPPDDFVDWWRRAIKKGRLLSTTESNANNGEKKGRSGLKVPTG